jgi:cobalt-zinc-cadmium efflux system membrane fusion protein
MPDLEFLTIRKAHAEAGIDLTTAEHRLHAIGVGQQQLAGLSAQAEDLAQFELRAPFAGTVIQKHCSPGEVLTADADAFMLADLSTVRVNITVYAQDIARVQMGQTVHLRAESVEGETNATIGYVSPVLNESTRAGLARADLPNMDRRWRPGMFVNTLVAFACEPVRVLVPLDSIQRMENSSVVFVEEGDGFEARPVVVGRSNAAAAEIVSGLEPGERYVTKGAFMVKADLVKGAVSHEH